MGCATSTFANRFSPRPLNFSWVTHSPGVSIHPVKIPLHRMRLAANVLATFLVRVAKVGGGRSTLCCFNFAGSPQRSVPKNAATLQRGPRQVTPPKRKKLCSELHKMDSSVSDNNTHSLEKSSLARLRAPWRSAKVQSETEKPI